MIQINKILNTVLKHINIKNKILVGFSGGLDSMVLLHALITIRNTILHNLNIRAIYINHNLSIHSYEWGIHCQKICITWDVDFIIHKVKLNFFKKNIECSAREIRYQIFKEILLPEEIIVTAHHLDDQAETFLLALKRGSGPAGLSSIAFSIPFGNTKLIRPLLSIHRQQLIYYAQKNNLLWIEDESNLDEYYDRNFLRINILSQLNKRWPYFSKSIARSAYLCREQETLLQELLKKCFLKHITPEGTLLINNLKEYSEIKRNVILRLWFNFHNILKPSYIQLKHIWKNIICAKSDANPQFFINNKIIRRFKQQLWFVPKYKDITNICLFWQMSIPIELPDYLGTLLLTNDDNYVNKFRAPQPKEQVTIRFGLKGNIKIINCRYSKKSKKIFQKLGIAPWLRTRIPLIYYNEILISAVNLFITECGKCVNGEPELKIQWIKKKYNQ